MKTQQLLIAEVKTQSPFGWKSAHSWNELFEIACDYGDWISIHTDARWGGSFKLLAEARKRTDKPILAKGIHATDDLIEKALDNGANYVLVVGRVPNTHIDRCLIEPGTIGELARLPEGSKAVWNSRDLATGDSKADQFEAARRQWSGWLCQASNIRTTKDIQPEADAVLVGSHLPGFVKTISSR